MRAFMLFLIFCMLGYMSSDLRRIADSIEQRPTTVEDRR